MTADLLLPTHRASETKVGVFYVRFTADNGNNDHVIVRLVGQDKSNRTMYSIKLYRVGSVSIFVSRLEANNQGHFEQEEDRKQTVQAAINLTDTTMYRGFWFTVRGEEISLGLIGDQVCGKFTDERKILKNTLTLSY